MLTWFNRFSNYWSFWGIGLSLYITLNEPKFVIYLFLIFLYGYWSGKLVQEAEDREQWYRKKLAIEIDMREAFVKELRAIDADLAKQLDILKSEKPGQD